MKTIAYFLICFTAALYCREMPAADDATVPKTRLMTHTALIAHFETTFIKEIKKTGNFTNADSTAIAQALAMKLRNRANPRYFQGYDAIAKRIGVFKKS